MANSPKVILLCGGKGERLRPLTSNTPKPLIPLNNKPILSYIFEHLEGYKLNDFIIATGYKAEKIDSFMDSIKPSFSYKTVNLGNADIIQRIKGVSKFLDSDFMVGPEEFSGVDSGSWPRGILRGSAFPLNEDA